MVNDILEQLVEDYLRNQGYFTQHNIKYRPEIRKSEYSVHSDIDIVAVHPLKQGNEKVIVVSCKSWQSGLNIETTLKIMKNNPRQIAGNKEIWKHFRELADRVWANALKSKIKKITGQDNFIFYSAFTSYKGDMKKWENFELFNENLKGCDIKLLDLKEMVKKEYEILDTTPSHSELSRLIQLIKASKGEIIYK